ETVRDIRTCMDTGTGIFFKEQTVAALVEAVEKFEADQDFLKSEYIKLHASQFSRQVFADRYLDFLNQCQEKRPSL
ncbi:MAG: glycosyltransferase family 4 protein, partial [Sphaerospermopsis kisseleviana]